MTVQEFIVYLSNNKELNTKYIKLMSESVKEIKGDDEIYKIMVKVASQIGFELEANDAKAYIDSIEKNELSDDELEAVVGGVGFYRNPGSVKVAGAILKNTGD